MGNKRDEASDAPPEERAAFLRENAVAVVAEKDRKIANLRERVRRLEQADADRRWIIKALNRRLDALAAERDRLREALEPFAVIGRLVLAGEYDGGWGDVDDYVRAAEALDGEG